MVSAGDKAPNFVAASTEGQVDFGALLKQGPVVLYFFPRAMTPG